MLAAASYLANKPDGGVLICLIIAIVCCVIAAVLAGMERVFWATLISAGLAFIVLAFLIK